MSSLPLCTSPYVSPGRCSICHSPEIHYEELRPTGKDGSLHAWPFCLSCWTELEAQRTSKDPWIAARYLVFLGFIGRRRDWPGHPIWEFSKHPGGWPPSDVLADQVALGDFQE